VGWLTISRELSESSQPTGGLAVLVEPAVNDSFVVGVNGTEDAWEDLKRQAVLKF